MTLFERTTRSVRLTADGSRFVARCREALAQIQIGTGEIAESRSAPTGTLVVSASPILARLVIAPRSAGSCSAIRACASTCG